MTGKNVIHSYYLYNFLFLFYYLNATVMRSNKDSNCFYSSSLLFYYLSATKLDISSENMKHLDAIVDSIRGGTSFFKYTSSQ